MLHVRDPRSGYPAEWESWAAWKERRRPEPGLVWVPCPTCWGQRTVSMRITPPRHPEPVYARLTCPDCLGLGTRTPNLEVPA